MQCQSASQHVSAQGQATPVHESVGVQMRHSFCCLFSQQLAQSRYERSMSFAMKQPMERAAAHLHQHVQIRRLQRVPVAPAPFTRIITMLHACTAEESTSR